MTTTGYVKPFINDQVLKEIFGDDAEKVKREFLVPGPGGNYFLKLEFATQRQVENHFAKLEASAQNQKLKEGLFDLISNVILFEVEKPAVANSISGWRWPTRFLQES